MDIKTISKWLHAKSKLSFYKGSEKNLREELCEEVLGGKEKGSKKMNFEQFELKATAKVNHTIGQDALKKDWKILPKDVRGCFKFKADVSVSALNKMPKDSPIWDYITVKPGLPGLEIKDTSIEEE